MEQDKWNKIYGTRYMKQELWNKIYGTYTRTKVVKHLVE